MKKFLNLYLKKTTLFVDDNLDNIEGAKKVGLQTWHLQVGNEDVIELEDYIQKNL